MKNDLKIKGKAIPYLNNLIILLESACRKFATLSVIPFGQPSVNELCQQRMGKLPMPSFKARSAVQSPAEQHSSQVGSNI